MLSSSKMKPSRPATIPCHPVSRRQILFAGGLSCAPLAWLSGCAAPPDSPAPSERSSELYWLANRITWGATDLDMQRLRELGVDAYIEQQLRPLTAVLPASVQTQIDGYRIQRVGLQTLVAEVEAVRKLAESSTEEEVRKAGQQAYQQDMNLAARETASRHLLRALYSPNQLHEQLTWFWFNHFNVHQYKSNIRLMLGDYEEYAIRRHALGRFRDMLGAVAHHPAMLRYLDNDRNAAGRLNENYARELLELHTLGVSGGYTQKDVQEISRVLTGHGTNQTDVAPKLHKEHEALYQRDGLYEFNPGRHDFGEKTVLGRRIKGQGAAELDQVLDILAVHPSTARFVSHKLAQFFMADEPPAALVQQMARTWVSTQGSIPAVVGTMVRSAEFIGPSASRFKTPVRYVISAMRACYVDRPILNTAPMINWLNRLGQGFYNRQTPDGYPLSTASWTSSGQMSIRLEIARAVGANSAGLFKSEDATAPREVPAFPQLLRPIYFNVIRPLLSQGTREALDNAGSPQDWNALYLSSPEFMYT